MKIEKGLRFYFEKYFIVNLLVKYFTMKQALKNAKIFFLKKKKNILQHNKHNVCS